MVKQLSVFIQNKSGKIAAVTRALYENGIDIRALSVADTTDFGILRMLVNDVEKARETLEREKCIVSVNEVDVVAVPDRPGGLAEVLKKLSDAKIDIVPTPQYASITISFLVIPEFSKAFLYNISIPLVFT